MHANSVMHEEYNRQGGAHTTPFVCSLLLHDCMSCMLLLLMLLLRIPSS
eukprot:COSAG04_NODE_884_length_9654_cov_39.264155_6_plen_49_part_00